MKPRKKARAFAHLAPNARIHKLVQRMGPEEKRRALVRLKTLGLYWWRRKSANSEGLCTTIVEGQLWPKHD